ncbi:hypothetical protein BGZ63DRAFT_371822 [Mariannaea sp. PMI_226]|nr:hypothetical protein BGZ63DRAFT_371822 [Mariannaea sp. PMI_226]
MPCSCEGGFPPMGSPGVPIRKRVGDRLGHCRPRGSEARGFPGASTPTGAAQALETIPILPTSY